jgi:DNA-directed RNA polymerase subunit beta'
MRTFHIGGAASRDVAISKVEVKSEGTVRLSNLKSVVNREGNLVAVSRSGEVVVMDEYGRERERYKIPYGAVLSKKEGERVEAGEVIVNWDPFTHPVITEVDGIVELNAFVNGVTVQSQLDAITGLTDLVVIDPKQRGSAGRELRPMVKLLDLGGNTIYLPGTEIPAQYFLPTGAIASIKDGGEVKIGDVLARIPQESSKTRDITGGLPRVADLFEARKTKDPAILAEATGIISFGKETKGKQRVSITDASGEQFEPRATTAFIACE